MFRVQWEPFKLAYSTAYLSEFEALLQCKNHPTLQRLPQYPSSHYTQKGTLRVLLKPVPKWALKHYLTDKPFNSQSQADNSLHFLSKDIHICQSRKCVCVAARFSTVYHSSTYKFPLTTDLKIRLLPPILTISIKVMKKDLNLCLEKVLALTSLLNLVTALQHAITDWTGERQRQQQDVMKEMKT